MEVHPGPEVPSGTETRVSRRQCAQTLPACTAPAARCPQVLSRVQAAPARSGRLAWAGLIAVASPTRRRTPTGAGNPLTSSSCTPDQPAEGDWGAEPGAAAISCARTGAMVEVSAAAVPALRMQHFGRVGSPAEWPTQGGGEAQPPPPRLAPPRAGQGPGRGCCTPRLSANDHGRVLPPSARAPLGRWSPFRRTKKLPPVPQLRHAAR